MWYFATGLERGALLQQWRKVRCTCSKGGDYYDNDNLFYLENRSGLSVKKKFYKFTFCIEENCEFICLSSLNI